MQIETSNSFSRTPEHQSRAANWTSIRLINVYRLGLSAIFFSQSFLTQSPLLTIVNNRLYSWVSFAFLLLSLIWMAAAWIERRGYQHQISLQIYSDTIIIILLMHACGGISSGLGMLLIISIAITSLLLEQSLALVFASLASLGLLAEYLYSTINIANYSANSTQVGILGATLFATAIVTHKLTQRVRSSEQLVRQRDQDVAQLSALNQEIIENMQAGVIVLTETNDVRHINNAALNMLGIAANSRLLIQQKHPKIVAALDLWRSSYQQDTTFLPAETGIDNIQVSFRQLQSQASHSTMIFLNDVSSIRSSMQQAKLASLGHLTASIAHEIRNPLGAISYAVDLLAENTELAETERRMTDIIRQHSDRINNIIEDILKISRGESSTADIIALTAWLTRFVDNYCLSNQATPEFLKLDIQVQNVTILFDAGHLSQVLTNLCDNARTHGTKGATIHLVLATDAQQKVFLEVADEGPGIAEGDMDQLFEPFFTTSHQGSGLGLYIVSQLCDLNNATISVRQNSYNGTSFVVYPQTSLAS